MKIQDQRQLLDDLVLSRGAHECYQHLVEIKGKGKLSKPVIHYIDMEPCSLDLEGFIRREEPFEGVDNIWKIIMQIASAVNFVHDCGIIVRDLKPSRSIFPFCAKTHSSSLFNQAWL